MGWIIALGVIVLIGFLLEREIYFYEGTHLGPRLQAWLYDRWSKKYDEGKRGSQLRDDEMLVRPLLEALSDVPEPFLLDFATGTGRLSSALFNRPDFKGNIVAVDLSQGMLEQAVAKLGKAERGRSAMEVQVEFLRHQSLPLPFPDAAFDAVCALEVLELLPNMEEPLRELTRVLRPGGILLTSRGTEESGRKARIKSVREFTALLGQSELEQVQVTKWWKLFDRVLAVKHGDPAPGKNKSLSQVLKCSVCEDIDWETTPGAWQCGNCGRKMSVTSKGIVLG